MFKKLVKEFTGEKDKEPKEGKAPKEGKPPKEGEQQCGEASGEPPKEKEKEKKKDPLAKGQCALVLF
jgi:hypothetical protein